MFNALVIMQSMLFSLHVYEYTILNVLTLDCFILNFMLEIRFGVNLKKKKILEASEYKRAWYS